jgi:hypothetical protein
MMSVAAIHLYVVVRWWFRDLLRVAFAIDGATATQLIASLIAALLFFFACVSLSRTRLKKALSSPVGPICMLMMFDEHQALVAIELTMVIMQTLWLLDAQCSFLFGIVAIWALIMLSVRMIQLRGLPQKYMPLYWAHTTKIVCGMLIVLIEFGTFLVRYFANDYSIILITKSTTGVSKAPGPWYSFKAPSSCKQWFRCSTKIGTTRSSCGSICSSIS